MTEVDLLDFYEQASAWTLGNMRGATEKLDSNTPCDDWNVRNLLNHMLDTQRYFTGAARGEEVSPPSSTPPDLLGDDPVQAFERSRAELLHTFAEPGVIEKLDRCWESPSLTSSSTAGILPWRLGKT